MESLKCTQCGGNISTESEFESEICPYCGCKFVLTRPEKSSPVVVNDGAATVINHIYYSEQAKSKTEPVKIVDSIPPRPKLNVFWAAIGLICYIVPGVIYIVYVTSKQQEWDTKYNKN